MWNPKTKKVSETRSMVCSQQDVLQNTYNASIKQGTGDDDLDSVQQDKRGGTITVDFVTGDNNSATVESMDSSVPDTPLVNGNQ
jgi:hypothetical protein